MFNRIRLRRSVIAQWTKTKLCLTIFDHTGHVIASWMTTKHYLNLLGHGGSVIALWMTTNLFLSLLWHGGSVIALWMTTELCLSLLGHGGSVIVIWYIAIILIHDVDRIYTFIIRYTHDIILPIIFFRCVMVMLVLEIIKGPSLLVNQINATPFVTFPALILLATL